MLLPIFAMSLLAVRASRVRQALGGIVDCPREVHTTSKPIDSTSRKPLRLRPAIVIAIVQSLLYPGIPVVAPDAAAFRMLAAVAGGLLILLWWLFFSRAPWLERVGAVILMIVAVAVTKFLSHVSIAGAGMGISSTSCLFPG